MKVLLCYLCDYNDRHDYYLSLLPYGLISIAAFLEQKGMHPVLANFSKHGWRGAVKIIEKEKPDIIGISIFTHNRTDSIKLIKEVKSQFPEIIIVAGGPHVSHLSEEFSRRIKQIDFLITGEGETACYDLIRKIEKGKVPERITAGERLVELDEIKPASNFTGRMIGINTNEQFKYLISSRGCPHECSFCCSPAFWKRKTEFRSAENLFNEVMHIHKKYGIIYFSIRDDNFTLRKDRVIKFSRLLRKSGIYMMWNCQSRVDTIDEDMLVEMKLSGLEHIQYGVESGSEKILKLYGKSIKISDILKACEITRKAGVYLSVYLMAGMAGENHGDIQKTIALMKKILPGDVVVSPAAYYPGTLLYNDMKKKGMISDDIWFKNTSNGIFVRNDMEVSNWINELITYAGALRKKSWYNDKDFKAHRNFFKEKSWVTEILYGDFLLDTERFEEAETVYTGVALEYQNNAWPYLRLGKLKFITGDFLSSASFYRKVTEIVPDYYGGWLKLGECQIAADNKIEAGGNINTASKLNPDDSRISSMKKFLKA